MRGPLTRPPGAFWVAWHLPDLPLESFLATLAPDLRALPWALCAGHEVQAVNAAAAALGVRIGQQRATALALAPSLRIGAANAQRDAEALQAVAHIALGFTPTVVFGGNQTVLADVASTLRLWGGWESLQVRLRQALAPLGHRIRWAAAPTALGAAWLACAAPSTSHSPSTSQPRTQLSAQSPSHGTPHSRIQAPHRSAAVSSGCDEFVHSAPDLPALHRVLDRLPLSTVPGFEDLLERAVAMGLHTLADLRALPRDGVTRRFGTACLQQIDRARGDAPDPQRPIRPPEAFASRLELFARADSGEQVMAGAQLLLPRLLAWARACQGRVERLTLTMHHEPRHRADDTTPATTPWVLALAEPSNDPSHLHSLLREHLARLQLPAPTLELSLHCAHLAPGPAPHGELFPTRASEHAGLQRLLERLQARLGPEQIQRLQPVEDHRPECATAWHCLDEPSGATEMSPKKTPGRPKFSGAPLGGRSGHGPDRGGSDDPTRGRPGPVDNSRSLTRPVWLLDPPLALPTPRAALSETTAWLDGQPLQVLAGPERIESGWWDGHPAVRDYFIAQSVDGSLVWIYRSRFPELDPQASGWFLQGRFA